MVHHEFQPSSVGPVRCSSQIGLICFLSFLGGAFKNCLCLTYPCEDDPIQLAHSFQTGGERFYHPTWAVICCIFIYKYIYIYTEWTTTQLYIGIIISHYNNIPMNQSTFHGMLSKGSTLPLLKWGDCVFYRGFFHPSPLHQEGLDHDETQRQPTFFQMKNCVSRIFKAMRFCQ